MSCLLQRVDSFAIEEDVHGAWRSSADPDWDAKFALDFVFEAHGRSFDLGSKETTFNFDRHERGA
ncbi:MAG TPA: hypothetical protein VH302_09125 [Bryobacteraceae bacterium]|nr:hypothetical protein [Bryobacteraceae bacterium]